MSVLKAAVLTGFPATKKARSRKTCRSVTIPMVNLLADGDPPSEPNQFGAGIVIVIVVDPKPWTADSKAE
jgi:hypothetical protein